MTQEWNAEEYHRLSDPQVAWGRTVLARLGLRGDERVADLGCGTGRLTKELAERLPGGQVVAIDASRQMIAQARAYLADVSSNVRFVQARLPEIPLAGWADVVFSTATFHWVRDHPALFSNILTALKPGGLLHAQCGGGRNLYEARRPAEGLMREPAFSRWFVDFQGAWEFADERVTRERLAAAGFTAIETSLEPAPVEFEDAASYRAFVATVVFRLHLARLPDALQPAFLDEIVERVSRLPQRFTLDYWRLNLRARKP